MPVRTMFFGMIRLAGLAEGPPIAVMFSEMAGPRSRGTALPVNTRPSRASENGTRMVWPRKRTSESVAMPRLPANTCR